MAKMWDCYIRNAWWSKVKEGVDVRVIYDDMGCIKHYLIEYSEKLEKIGDKM